MVPRGGVYHTVGRATSGRPPGDTVPAVRHRPLGRSGLVVSVVGLGCNNIGGRLDLEATSAILDAASDVGLTLLDTADSYGGSAGRGASEAILGEALAGRREDFVLATKFGNSMDGAYGDDHGARGSRRYVRRAVEGSLRRLRTDHLDLYQYHRPDGVTPLEETLAALHELVQEGKVRYLGSSNFAGWQVVESSWLARTQHRTPFVSEQSEYSLLRRGLEAGLVPALQHCGVGLLPYFPLASGILTGKVRRGTPAPAGSRLTGAYAGWLTEEAYDLVERLLGYAQQRGRSMLDVAIGGLAAQPTVASVIAGATSPEQLRANAAAGDWEPSAADLAALDEVAPGPRHPPSA